jgi:hypothetical protein
MNHNIEHHDDLHIERFADRGESSTSRKTTTTTTDDANGRTSDGTRVGHAEPQQAITIDLKDSGEEKESEG